MAVVSHQEIVQFAEDVERLCDFILDRIRKDHGGIGGSRDENVIIDLKETAEKISRPDNVFSAATFIEGIADVLR